MGEIREPDNAKVEDWHGQDVARDREEADRALFETAGDEEKAEQLFEQRRGENRQHAQGFNRPS